LSTLIQPFTGNWNFLLTLIQKTALTASSNIKQKKVAEQKGVEVHRHFETLAYSALKNC
jgi:hypothetical protein